MAENNMVNADPALAEKERMEREAAMRLEQFKRHTAPMLQQLKNSRSKMRSIQTYSQERLIEYLKDTTRHYRELINISWYLYYRSTIYRRIVNYYANMFELGARNIVPEYSLTKKNNPTKMKKSYYETISLIDKMDLQGQFLTIYLTCFIQDVFFGFAKFTDHGFYIVELPMQYCKIAGIYDDGSLAFKFNTKYFQGQNAVYLEYWGEPFTSMVEEAKRKAKEKGVDDPDWVYVPPEHSVCLKYTREDLDSIVPPLSGLFAELSALEDKKNLQNAKDAQSAYKLLYYTIPLISGAKSADQYAVDPDLAIEYIESFLEDAVPDYISFGMVPGEKLGTVSFNDDSTTETSNISKATEAVLNTAGGAEILNGATISTAEAMRIASMVNTEFAISSLLPQTEVIVNRLISYQLSNPSRVHFFPVSAYTKEKLKKEMLESNQYGFANKIAYNTLNNISEKDTLAMLEFENEVLGITEKMVPLQSSYTQSGSVTEGTDPETGGRPKSDDSEISTSGDKERERLGIE